MYVLNVECMDALVECTYVCISLNTCVYIYTLNDTNLLNEIHIDATI